MNDGVGVVIPTYNCAQYIGEALDSVLEQSVPVSRIVIVDDGSCDETARTIARFKGPIQYLYQENAGIGAARNTGVAAVDSKYLAFLDADDYWARDKVERQLEAIETGSLDAVFGTVVEFDEGAPRSSFMPGDGRDIQGGGARLASSMLISRAAFLRVGYFRTDVRVGEFIEWFLRFRQAGLREEALEQPTVYRRLHANNTGIRWRSERSHYHRVLKDALDRRRRSAT